MNSMHPEYVDCIVTEGDVIVFSGEAVIIVITTLLIITLFQSNFYQLALCQTGSREEADAILRPGFEIEDLAGRCLMPGFIGDFGQVDVVKRFFFENQKRNIIVECLHLSPPPPSQTRTSTRPWRL